MSEAEAVAVHLQDMDVMGETVEQSPGEPLGTEHRCPLVERQVAGNHRRAALVALRDRKSVV